MNANLKRKAYFQILAILAVIAMVFGQVSPAAAQSPEPPKPDTVSVQGKTTLKGFDPKEYGGNDANCTRTELESIHIGEVVSSPNEKCLIVVEWSLKNGEQTVVTGVHALAPGEWYYVPLAVGGHNDQVRVVGTLWYLPKGWNSHQYAIDIAKDRDERDATDSIVGLSPTDRWVLWHIDQLSGALDGSDGVVNPTPVPEPEDVPADGSDGVVNPTPVPEPEDVLTGLPAWFWPAFGICGGVLGLLAIAFMLLGRKTDEEPKPQSKPVQQTPPAAKKPEQKTPDKTSSTKPTSK